MTQHAACHTRESKGTLCLEDGEYEPLLVPFRLACRKSGVGKLVSISFRQGQRDVRALMPDGDVAKPGFTRS